MRRMWIGVGLLVLVLVAGILAAEWMGKTHEKIGADIEQAAALATEEKWEKAIAQMNLARRKWEKKRPVIAMLADHEPLEIIDSLFSQLEVYAASGDVIGFCTTCACLRSQLEILGDCHKINVSNLL